MCRTFVTRMKDNTLYEVIKEQEIPENSHILKDDIIRLTGTQTEEKHPHLLRRIEVRNPEKTVNSNGLKTLTKRSPIGNI